jgi:two-component system chemotaxis response regulator CheB
LTRVGPLEATQPEDGELIAKSHIYVACPDHHLLIEPGRVRVARGPKENRHRPAIDPLFRSAAVAYGPCVTGVILTGSLDDGTHGLLAVKQRGGIAVVQDPSDAYYPSMPLSAIRNVQVDYIVPLSKIPALLVRLTGETAPEEGAYPVPENMEIEANVAAMRQPTEEELNRIGTPSTFACPDCHGTLWEMHNGDMVRFRCRVGHAYSVESMFAQHSESLENALWGSLRALEESAALARRMANRAREQGHQHLEKLYSEKVVEQERHAEIIKKLLAESGDSGTTEMPA